jgi:prepilin-type N-terminal cleavage/methylation domain-containing protein
MNYIKTNNRWAHQRGTTLIELSVVIAVILLLVGVLFIGVQAWRDGANKSACLVNISSIQKAVRGYQNINNLNTGQPLTTADLTTAPAAGGAAFFTAMPTCPVGGVAYGALGKVPDVGIAYATCASTAAAVHNPTAAQTANW